MTEQPATAAGRALLIEPPNSDEEARVAYLAIEDEARQQDGSALRRDMRPVHVITEEHRALERLSALREAALYALAFMNDPEGLDAVREEWRDRLRAALAALPPSAPSALDVEVARVNYADVLSVLDHLIDKHRIECYHGPWEARLDVYRPQEQDR